MLILLTLKALFSLYLKKKKYMPNKPAISLGVSEAF